MKRLIPFFKGKPKLAIHSIRNLIHKAHYILRKQFNKNIYTKIVFTNVSIYILVFVVLGLIANITVQEAIYSQAEQELLRKAKRVNFALMKEISFNSKADNRTSSTGDLLIFLADSFDTRITIFDLEGVILHTSAEQDVVPGGKVDTIYTKLLKDRKINITRSNDNETGAFQFIAVIPMGKTEDADAILENGILLEMQSSNLEQLLNRMRWSLLITGMIILIITIVISIYLSMNISEPISRLATNVTEIGRDNIIPDEVNQSFHEINILSGQLNKLAIRIQNIVKEKGMIEEESIRLFADVSHELRTPLTAVQGFTEAIRDGMVEDEILQKKYLDLIYTQTLHINRLVDDILDLSRLESGNVTVEKVPLDLAALAKGVVSSMEVMARSKNNDLIIENKTESAVVLGDADRMEQILRNLIKNAIRATEKGIIKFRIEAREQEVFLTIEDNGIGIAPEDLPHIWDRFYRVANQRYANIEEKGTGLGLVIVKQLVQLQGGSIDVESQLGKGTIFHICFKTFLPDMT